MRKFFLFVFTFICITTTAQEQNQTTLTPAEQAKNLMIKSKKQRTTGFILAGTGGTMVIISVSLAMNDLVGLFDEENKDSGDAIDILGYGGLALIAGSIPFFVMSGQNKRKARLMTSTSVIEIAPGVKYGNRQFNVGIALPIN